MTGIGIGIPASSLAINRRLYKISSVRQVMVTHAEKRREMIIDFAISLGFPCVVMILRMSHSFLECVQHLMKRRVRCAGTPVQHL